MASEFTKECERYAIHDEWRKLVAHVELPSQLVREPVCNAVTGGRLTVTQCSAFTERRHDSRLDFHVETPAAPIGDDVRVHRTGGMKEEHRGVTPKRYPANSFLESAFEYETESRSVVAMRRNVAVRLILALGHVDGRGGDARDGTTTRAIAACGFTGLRRLGA